MNHKNSNEEVKRYEKEFSEFLIEKINHAGGSLQFQHLSGILQQLRFEVRNAVASTKPDLMKFLRTNPKIFKIDSKGVVSVVNPILHEGEDDDDDDLNLNNNTKQGSVVPAKKNFRPKIDKGEGKVMKINPEFAIIKAVTPIRTCVYFTPLEYGADKESLFGIDIDLGPHTKVFFNAEHGHPDYGIEYRATKVWPKPDSDDEITDSQNHKKNKNAEKSLKGKGVIKDIFPNFGFISTDSRNLLDCETVLFYKSSVQDCDTDFAKYFKVGDRVEFTAEPAVSGSKAKWQALSVIKRAKQSSNESSHTNCAENIKNPDASGNKKNRIENQPGKIYAYEHGAVIKFGIGYSQKADGDSSDYFLYGSKVKVSDIMWEFSEGDDVLFDAVKMKKLPGWKAYLVWIGEKPTSRNIPKVEDDSDEITEEQSSSSVVSSDCSNSLMKSRTKDKKYFNPENKENKKSCTTHTRSNTKKSDKFQDEHRKENCSRTKTNDRNISVNVPKFKKTNCKSDKRSLASNKFAKKNNNMLLTELSSYAVKHDKNSLASKENASNIHIESSEDSSEDYEFHDATSNPRKFLIKEKYDDSSSSPEEINYDNESNELRQNNENKLISKKACIEKFEGVEGKIIDVLCKAAIIRSPVLQKNVDFVLSAFYLNGESAEERQVIDLKEIIHVGELINFNCFKIIDDTGTLYQKVTLAWKGPKPDVYETTPEDFISENELSVSLRTNVDDSRNKVNDIEFKSSEKSDKTADFYSETESTLNITHDDKVVTFYNEPETEISEDLNDSDHSSVNEDKEESLSNKIIQRLKMYGFFSEDSQVDLKIIPEIIDLVLLKYRIADAGSHAINQDGTSSEVLCPSCLSKSMSLSNKPTNAKHAAVQTIVTGDIVATSIYTQN